MRYRFSSLLLLTMLLAACSSGRQVSMTPAVPEQPQQLSSGAFIGGVAPQNDDILIADQLNNRVIEIDRNHTIDWHFGDGSSTVGKHSVVAPNDAERVDALTLIAGTGAIAGSEPSCPEGCSDNRVILVDQSGNIVWQYGQDGVGGHGPNQLLIPVAAVSLPNKDILITDQGNQRVIEVSPAHCIVSQYGTTGVSGAGFNQLNSPNSAELLKNGHLLIADELNNRVIEVNRATHAIVWQYGSPSANLLRGAAFASRLDNGDTLITDTANSRILEVDQAKRIVWFYFTNARPGSVAIALPNRAVRLRNGDTLISDQFNHQVIEVDHTKRIVFAQGRLGVPGTGFNELSGPMDAKVIGDFTGLTPPH